MPVRAKICGLKTAAAVDAAIAGGAAYVGLMFYAPSPRYAEPGAAGALAERIPASITKVGVFVDPGDDYLAATLAACPLDMLQLHGKETPERVLAVKERFSLPVMKAVQVAEAADLDRARAYEQAADRLLFDAKPPKTMADALPGGNALAFDWQLLAGVSWSLPWMLSGGLDAANVAQAVAISKAYEVDVSSGVETAPGEKDSGKIAAFLEQVHSL
jgi:phosphoribosylanthranilate isomerase